MMMTPLQAAQALKRRGLSPIPVPAREKNPNRKDWQQLIIAEADLPRYFNGAEQNIGVLTGAPSGDHVDVDLDVPEAVHIGALLLPTTHMRHGRGRNPHSHFWYRAPNVKTERFQFVEAGQHAATTLAELRGTGTQTLVPPSEHDTDHGDHYAWDELDTAADIPAGELRRRVAIVAAAALIARHWPGAGARDDAALALSGMLAHGGAARGWDATRIDAFVLAVASAAGDEEARDRGTKGQRAVARVAAGEAVTGAPKLVGLLRDGVRVVEQVRRWLELGSLEPVEQQPEGDAGAAATEEAALADARRQLAGLAERATADRGAPFEPDMLRALVQLQRGDLAAWVRLREELRRAGVPLRDLEKALGRAAFKVVPGSGGEPYAPNQSPMRPVGGPYRLVNGAICLEKESHDPFAPQMAVSVPFCNFSAHIAAEEVHDDGAEQTTVLVIEGRLQSGEALPRARLGSDRYGGMAWVTAHWGARAVVYAGQAMKDHLRAAIQLLSGAPPRVTIYGHTGWRHVADEGWVYLHAAGALGADGAVPAVQVLLDDALSHYVLPEPPSGADLVTAIRASLALLEVAPATVTIPLYAAIWRAPLGGVDFSLHLWGPTGEGKTELASLAQQHYGAAMGARALAANWSSTANALEALAFQTKDAILTVDDFAPHGSAADVQRFHRDADRLFRAQGNASGRHRMQADTRLRPVKPPRGLLVSTGEEVPHGQSLRARLLILEHAPRTLHWQRLTRCQQQAARGLYAQALAGYVCWLAPQYDAVQQGMRAELLALREQASTSQWHKRTLESVANLAFGLHTLLRYAVAVGALTSDERDALWARAWQALGQVSAAQARYQAESEPTQRFIELLTAALASGKAHVAAPNGQAPTTPEAWGWRQRTVTSVGSDWHDWQAQGPRIGWLDAGGGGSGDAAAEPVTPAALYLEPEAAYVAAQALGQQAGDGLTISSQTLRRRLHERGLLVTTDKLRETLTIRRTLEGKQRTVLHVSPDLLSPPTGPDKPDKPSRRQADGASAPEECRVLLSGSAGEEGAPDNNPTGTNPDELQVEEVNVGFVGLYRGEETPPDTPHFMAAQKAPALSGIARETTLSNTKTRQQNPTNPTGAVATAAAGTSVAVCRYPEHGDFWYVACVPGTLSCMETTLGVPLRASMAQCWRWMMLPRRRTYSMRWQF
jgi:Bifunctional DNA primase/polymerase, N-terminal/Domain of unknown function (DUF927)